MKQNRRSFIRNSAVATAGIGLLNGMSTSACSIIGANDKVNIGLIGTGAQGLYVLDKHLKTGQVNCIALCDVDKKQLEKGAAQVLKSYNQKPILYNDFRKILENKELDAIIIGTPDHWHCIPTVYACQAGLDVYLEKPMANTIEECNIITKAAKRYNRVVQIGQQQRSGAHWQKINAMIKDGHIGKLRKVNTWGNFDYGIGLPKQPDQPVPDGVDYDFWLGPAPERSFNPTRFHRKWRMFWDYGGGLMTDWGCHLLDMAFWAKDIKTPPKAVMVSGGNMSFENYNHETFDTMSVIFDVEDYTVTWEHTAGTQNGPWGKNYGLAFVGDLGTILVNRSGYEVIPEWDEGQKKTKIAEESGEGATYHYEHAKNFIDSVRTRKTPACTPETGRVVAVAAHMANVALRSGANFLKWDDEANKFTNSSEANKFIVPEYRAPWILPKI